MLTVFNRKEVYQSYDVDELSRVRWALKDAGIKYAVKVANQSGAAGAGSSRSRGAMGFNPKYSYIYSVYVHKNDAEDAKYHIHGALSR